ncbi:uncharacterized protein PG986_004068 [Apiospora aurea]|uniref:Uncharacterized protein n=1 Tax=Apiospora aurea TaxID=335848 RepID=A0ABR1QN39_9PEZI
MNSGLGVFEILELSPDGKRKAAVHAGRNHAGQVGTDDQARVRIGHEFAFANGFSGSGFAGVADQYVQFGRRGGRPRSVQSAYRDKLRWTWHLR